MELIKLLLVVKEKQLNNLDNQTTKEVFKNCYIIKSKLFIIKII